MKITETVITTAGVFRCCIASIGEDLEKHVELGDETACRYCGEEFRLVQQGKKFMWRPIWQLEKEV